MSLVIHPKDHIPSATPLLGSDSQGVPPPFQFAYRRVHTSDPNIELEIPAKIEQDFGGVLVATFGPCQYVPEYEKELRALGVDLIVIEPYREIDSITATREEGFYLIPKQVSWRVPTNSFERHLKELGPKTARDLQRNLDKSSALLVEINPLSVQRYQEWYPIYESEVAGRERGREVIGPEWAATKKNLSSYQLITYRATTDGPLMGGAIIHTDRKNHVCTISYAAYQSELKKYNAGARTFKEVVDLSAKNGIPTISHGVDRNLYGQYLSVGLLEQKARLGFIPQPRGAIRLVKILDPESFNNHMAFFVYDEAGALECTVLSDKGLKISVPRGMEATYHSVSEIPMVEMQWEWRSILRGIVGARSETGEQTVRAAATLGAPHLKRALDVHPPLLRSGDPQDRAAAWLGRIFSGNCSREAVSKVLDYFSITWGGPEHEHEVLASQMLSDRSLLASAINQIARHDLNYLHIVIPEILLSELGTLKPLEGANASDQVAFLHQVLEAVESEYGEAAASRFLTCLLALENIDKASPSELNPRAHLSPRGHCDFLAVEEILWSLPEENRDKMRALSKELYGLLLHPEQAGRFNHLLNDIVPLSETCGGIAANYVSTVLTDPSLITDSSLVGPAGIGPRFRTILSSLKALLPKIEPSAERTLAIASLPLLTYPTDIESALYDAGIDAGKMELYEKNTLQIFEQIFREGTYEQISTVLKNCDRLGFSRTDLRPILSQIPLHFPDHAERAGLPLLPLELQKEIPGAVKQFAAVPDNVWLDGDFQYQLETKLALEHTATPNTILGRPPIIIVARYCATFGAVPNCTTSELISWEEERGAAGNSLSVATEAYINNPGMNIDIDRAKRLLESTQFPSRGVLEPNEMLFLLRLLREESLEPLVREKLFNDWKGTNVLYFDVGQKDFENDNEKFGLSLSELRRGISGLATTQEDKERIQVFLTEWNRSTLQDVHSSRISFCLRVCAELDIPSPELWSDARTGMDKKNYFSAAEIAGALVGKPSAAKDATRTWIHALQFLNEEDLSEVLLMAKVDPGRNPEGYVTWDRAAADAPSPGLATWMTARSAFGAPAIELLDYAQWRIEEAKKGASIPAEFFTALNVLLADIPAPAVGPLIEEAKALLQSKPLGSGRCIEQFLEILDGIDPNADLGIAAPPFINAEFIRAHPWGSYGYPPPVVDRVTSYCDANDFTPRQARLLATLLCTCSDQPWSRTWISQIILAQRESNFSQLVQFSSFIASMPYEARMSMIHERVGSLLEMRQADVVQQYVGKPIEEIETKIQEAVANNSPISPRLLARRDQLNEFRSLFVRLTHSSRAQEREVLKNEIEARLPVDFPLRLVGHEEIRSLIGAQQSNFLDRLSYSPDELPIISGWIQTHYTPLRESGILDRLTQFGAFADPQGVRMLKTLLLELSDPRKARIIECERPDSNRNSHLNIDYFAKFEELRSMLLKRGVEENLCNDFINRWSCLWNIAPKPFHGEGVLCVTHDIERWLKHGEEPVLTCQKVSTRSGNMRESNWNYQFGPNPNIDGRPLARPLSPQLALAEVYRNGTQECRAVLEVTTTKSKKGHAVPALLVEKFHASERWKAADPNSAQTRKELRRFGQKVLIDPQNVFFSEDRYYPDPLPEKFRFYRDTFRPNES